jgi:hypothetical protein
MSICLLAIASKIITKIVITHKYNKYERSFDKNPRYTYSTDSNIRYYHLLTDELVRVKYSFEIEDSQFYRISKPEYGLEINSEGKPFYIVKGIALSFYKDTYIPSFTDERNGKKYKNFEILDTRGLFPLMSNKVSLDKKFISYDEEDKKITRGAIKKGNGPNIITLGNIPQIFDANINDEPIQLCLFYVDDSTIAITDLFDTSKFYREFVLDKSSKYLFQPQITENRYFEIYYENDDGERKKIVFDIEEDCVQETKNIVDTRTKFIKEGKRRNVTKQDFDRLLPDSTTYSDIIDIFGDSVVLLKEDTVFSDIVHEEYSVYTGDSSFTGLEFKKYIVYTGAIRYKEIDTGINYKEYGVLGEDYVIFMTFKEDVLGVCEYIAISNFY